MCFSSNAFNWKQGLRPGMCWESVIPLSQTGTKRFKTDSGCALKVNETLQSTHTQLRNYISVLESSLIKFGIYS
jgi:hypothetical protein